MFFLTFCSFFKSDSYLGIKHSACGHIVLREPHDN